MGYCESVNRIIRFCEMLTVPDGMLAGQKVVLSSEQKRFINAVYGPRTANGLRIVRDALLSMAMHLCLTNNALAWINRVNDRVVEILPLEPDTYSIERDGWAARYRVTGKSGRQYPEAKALALAVRECMAGNPINAILRNERDLYANDADVFGVSAEYACHQHGGYCYG